MGGREKEKPSQPYVVLELTNDLQTKPVEVAVVLEFCDNLIFANNYFSTTATAAATATASHHIHAPVFLPPNTQTIIFSLLSVLADPSRHAYCSR